MFERSRRLFALSLLILSGITAAIVVLGKLDSYAAKNRDRHDNEAKADAAYARQQFEAECVRVSGAVSDECRADAEKAAQHAGQPNPDLKAQQEMAQWAYLAAWFAVIGTGITATGVAYVALTLKEARLATEAATIAANAAVKANEGFQRSAQTELRAYVTVKSSSVYLRETVGEDGKRTGQFRLEVYTEFINSGSTPALELSSVGRLALCPEAEFRATPLRSEHTDMSITVLGAQATSVAAASLPRPKDATYDLARLAAVQADGEAIWQRGRFSYKDVFGVEWELLYCHSMPDLDELRKDGDNRALEIASWGNSFGRKDGKPIH